MSCYFFQSDLTSLRLRSIANGAPGDDEPVYPVEGDYWCRATPDGSECLTWHSGRWVVTQTVPRG